jgi:hypothetical protein
VRGKWLQRIDAAFWAVGVLLAITGVYDGLRSGRSLTSMMRGTWAFASGIAFVVASLAMLMIFARWRAAREEADLLRKYRGKGGGTSAATSSLRSDKIES